MGALYRRCGGCFGPRDFFVKGQCNKWRKRSVLLLTKFRLNRGPPNGPWRCAFRRNMLTASFQSTNYRSQHVYPVNYRCLSMNGKTTMHSGSKKQNVLKTNHCFTFCRCSYPVISVKYANVFDQGSIWIVKAEVWPDLDGITQGVGEVYALFRILLFKVSCDRRTLCRIDRRRPKWRFQGSSFTARAR